MMIDYYTIKLYSTTLLVLPVKPSKQPVQLLGFAARACKDGYGMTVV